MVSDSSIGALLDEMKLMQTEKVMDTALQNSITYLSGSFSIVLEDPKRVAQFAINIERYHMPKDFYQNYLKNLSLVTSDDVVAMSKKYIRPENANIVVAGSKEEVADKLARFSADGKIDYYDYSGKPVVLGEKKALPSNLSADDVHKKYIEAMGGEKAYASVKDLTIISTSEMQGMPLTITEMKKAPGMWKQSIEAAMGGKNVVVQKQVFNGTTGYQQQMGGPKADLTGNDLDDVRESADFNSELHPEKYGIKRTLKGIETVDGKDAYVVETVNSKGKKSTEYYDVATAMLVRKVQVEDGPKEPITVTMDYKNYKEVPGTNGYKVPYIVLQDGGGQTMNANVKTVEANKGIADTEFN